MLDKSILDNNLNEIVDYKDFFRAFGFTDNDQIYLRSFLDKSKDDKGHNMDILFCVFDHILPTLRERNAKGEGIFFIPNGDGQKDKLVKHARAQYADFDDYSFLEQIEKLNGFELEPSIIIKSKKSLHPYWLLRDGDIRYFREIQERLIQYFGSDVRIKNESRVMRLYGFEHHKTDTPTLVKLLKFNPELKYTQRQFHELLPRLTRSPKKNVDRTVPTQSDRGGKVLIQHGKRHGYLIERLGYYVQTIGDTSDDEMIFALLWSDFQQNCENDDHLDYDHIRSHYFNEIEKTRAKFAEDNKDPGFFKYARKAWMHEHPGEEFDPNVVGWSAIEAAGHRAKEEGKIFDDNSRVDAGWKKRVDGRQYPTTTKNEGDAEIVQPEEISLELTQSGEVKNTFSNVRNILEQDEYLKGKFSYNMQNGLVYLSGFYWNKLPHVIRDSDVTEIRSYIADSYGIAPSKDRSEELIQMIAERNKFHPVRDLLEELKSRGRPTTDNIRELLPRYLGAERSTFTTQATKLLLYGIIQRQFSPGVKFDYCMIFVDELQGTGKSTLCRMLAIKDDWFTDSLSTLDDPQKAFEAINGCVVVELGEMLSIRRAKDVEGIKSFLTRTVDKIRRPYLRHSEEFPRQCVFIGTSNKFESLPQDPSGNRRFVPIFCDGKKAEKHPLDNEKETREFVLQCFADAMILGESEGWPLVLDHEFDATLDQLREQGTPDDPRVGMIQQYLDDHKLIEYVCSRLIWDEVFSDCDHPKEPQSYELRDISDIMNLKIEGWKRYEFEDGSLRKGQRKHKFTDEFKKYGSQRAWRRLSPFEPGARVIAEDDE